MSENHPIIEGEIWKPVVGFPHYEVSNLGRVRSEQRERTSGGIRKQRWRSNYLSVGLSRDKEETSHLVHRLVAAAFIGSCPQGHSVNHKNGDREDNRPENLEYCTPSENQRHAATVLKRWSGSSNHGAKLTESQVVEMRKLWDSGRMRGRRLAKKFGVSRNVIYPIVHRKAWKHVEF